MAKLRVVVSGISGYGKEYLKLLAEKSDSLEAELVGIVCPESEDCSALKDELGCSTVPTSDTVHGIFEQIGSADLTIVASPIHFHYEQCFEALNSGSNVLCEKPAVSVYSQANILEDLARKKNLQMAVAYPKSFSDAFLKLKKDAVAGRFGRAVSMRSLVLTSKSIEEYNESTWAGKLYGEEGRVVMDGIMHGQASHQLHAMLDLLGSDMESAAHIQTVCGEWCRLNNISSYDTAVIRVASEECPSVLCAATNAYAGREEFHVRYEWEHAFLDGQLGRDSELIVHAEDGEINYGKLNHSVENRLRITLDCLRSGMKVPCSISSAKAEVAAVDGLYLSAGRVAKVPKHKIQKYRGMPGTPDDGRTFLTSKKIKNKLTKAFASGLLPSEMGKAFGEAPKLISMEMIEDGIYRAD